MKVIFKPTLEEEKLLWTKGYKYVIGLDEVGRGSFAGPVVVAAVAFDKEIIEKKVLSELSGVDDSKRVKALKRIALSKEIKSCSNCSIISIPVSIINKKGIGKATEIGFRKAVKQILNQRSKIKNQIKGTDLKIENCELKITERFFVLVDGFHVKYLKGFGLKNQKAIIKGDQKSVSIAAASIIAKSYRDKIMKRLHKKYPRYHFGKNKGYGTKEHQSLIKKYGLCRIHRKSFNLARFT